MPPVLTPTPALRAGREVSVLDKQQAVLVVGMPCVDVASPEMAQALLFQAWCSDMAGPVFTNIREEAGLAYYASSSLFIGMDAGGICFYLGTSPEQLEEAGRRLEKTLEMIHERGMTEEDARACIVSGFADDVSKELPLEYAVEMNNLIRLEMKGSIG